MAKLRILVVEDDSINREFLTRFLRRHGFDVHAVSDGEQGIAQLESRPFDIVLLDLMLPGKNGGEVAWCARQLGIDVPIVVYSAAMDLWDRSDLEDLGVTVCLEKPFSNTHLLGVLSNLGVGAAA